MWNALVDRYEGLKTPCGRVQQRTVVQIAPAEFRCMLDLEADELAGEPLRYAGVEQNSRLRCCHSLGRDRLGKKRRLGHLKNRNRVFPSHAGKIHEKVVE